MLAGIAGLVSNQPNIAAAWGDLVQWAFQSWYAGIVPGTVSFTGLCMFNSLSQRAKASSSRPPKALLSSASWSKDQPSVSPDCSVSVAGFWGALTAVSFLLCPSHLFLHEIIRTAFHIASKTPSFLLLSLPHPHLYEMLSGLSAPARSKAFRNQSLQVCELH